MSPIRFLILFLWVVSPSFAWAQKPAETDFKRLAPKVTRTLQGHTKLVRCLVFSPDSQTIASGSLDGQCRLWNVKNGRLIHTLDTKSETVWSIAFSPDGNLLAAGDRANQVTLWNPKTGKLEKTLNDHDAWANAVAFTPDGKLLASGDDLGFIRLWTVGKDVDQSRVIPAIQGVISLHFSPDGKLLLSGHKNRLLIKVWDVETGKQLHEISPEGSNLRSARFSPDGQMIGGVATSMGLGLWNVENGKQLGTFPQRAFGSDDVMTAVGWSPDGRMIVSVGTYTLVFREVGNGQVRERIQTRDLDQNSSMALSPDGKFMVTGGGSASPVIKLWKLYR